MKILTVDVGTGTQDIFLYNSELDIENGYKLIVPSPTMIIRKRLKQATQKRQPVLLTGVMMGGGPSFWAVQEHLRQNLSVFATPAAARTFNDDLNIIRQMGIQIISADEADQLPSDVLRLEMRDFDFQLIENAFSQFDVSLHDIDALAIAVFDHGNAPPDVSDRKFRFDYIESRLHIENRLSTFAFLQEDVPEIMTRMQAVIKSAYSTGGGFLKKIPLILMDTAPAAVLGATLDPVASMQQNRIVVNIGNLHTLAFRMNESYITGVFEHHTGLLNSKSLEKWLRQLADSNIRREDVYNDHGHGALIHPNAPEQNPSISSFEFIVTGPRRNLLYHSSLNPYFAVPFGDMMLAGCFGLLAATADLIDEYREPIQASLKQYNNRRKAPWELD